MYPSGLSTTTPPASQSIPYASCVFLETSKYTRPTGIALDSSSAESIAAPATIVRYLMVIGPVEIEVVKGSHLSTANMEYVQWGSGEDATLR